MWWCVNNIRYMRRGFPYATCLGHTHTHIYIHKHTHTHIHKYTHTHIHAYVCYVLCLARWSYTGMHAIYPYKCDYVSQGIILDICRRRFPCQHLPWCSICVCIYVYITQVIFAPLLGFVVNFFPHPVISGFVTAGGIIIAISQLEYIMGYEIRNDTLHLALYDLFANIYKIQWTTFVMGAIAAVFLVFVKKLGQVLLYSCVLSLFLCVYACMYVCVCARG